MVDVAENGKKVSVEYTGSFEDGKVFDKSEGRGPLVFVLGKKMVVPGFEAGVVGMKVGEKKSVTLKPSDAYGEPRKELIQEAPLEKLGDMKDKVEVGMVLGMHVPGAPQPLPAKVIEKTDSTVKLDLNHPLAGKTLKFDLELVKVEEVSVADGNSGAPVTKADVPAQPAGSLKEEVGVPEKEDK